MNKDREMHAFMGRHPGLQNKLAWFYNNYVAKTKAINKTQLFDSGIESKLRKKFPGYDKIYQFRNNISHGVIDRSLANLDDAKKLRMQAKVIVDELFKIAEKADYHIPRTITYEVAISS